MTTNLPATYQPDVLAAQMDYAKALAASSLLPRQYQGQPANLLWAISYGQTLGVDPMTAVQSVHVINGKPTASADLIAGLVRRAGHKLRVTGDDRKAVAQIIRADDPDFTFEAVWTIERAQGAKLTGKDTWKSFPAAMLKARAITEVARAACSEILHGTIYTPEELGANVDADGAPVDADVRSLRRVPAGEADQWTTPAPQSQTVPPARDYLAEARSADTPEQVRDIYLTAGADPMSPPELAAQLEAIGREKAAATAATSAAEAEPVDAEVVPDGDDHARAVADLRAAAAKARITDVDAEFEASYGLPPEQATTANVREMAALLGAA